jgi:hypothetical protein
MGIEEFLPAILVIVVIYFTVKWLSGPSKPFHPCLLAFSRNADDVGHTTNPDGSIPGVTLSMVCSSFKDRIWKNEED